MKPKKVHFDPGKCSCLKSKLLPSSTFQEKIDVAHSFPLSFENACFDYQKLMVLEEHQSLHCVFNIFWFEFDVAKKYKCRDQNIIKSIVCMMKEQEARRKHRDEKLFYK